MNRPFFVLAVCLVLLAGAVSAAEAAEDTRSNATLLATGATIADAPVLAPGHYVFRWSHGGPYAFAKVDVPANVTMYVKLTAESFDRHYSGDRFPYYLTYRLTVTAVNETGGRVPQGHSPDLTYVNARVTQYGVETRDGAILQRGPASNPGAIAALRLEPYAGIDAYTDQSRQVEVALDFALFDTRDLNSTNDATYDFYHTQMSLTPGMHPGNHLYGLAYPTEAMGAYLATDSVDLYAVNVPAGKDLKVTLTTRGTAVPTLELYNADQRPVVKANTTTASGTVTLNYTSKKGQVGYVRVSAEYGYATYDLNVTVSDPAQAPKPDENPAPKEPTATVIITVTAYATTTPPAPTVQVAFNNTVNATTAPTTPNAFDAFIAWLKRLLGIA